MQNDETRKKIVRRIFSFSMGAANNFTGLAFGFLLSWLIADFNTWGEYVYWSLIVNVLTFFAGWGNKEFVIREISRYPARINTIWTTDIFSRLILIGVALLVFILIAGNSTLKLLAAGWLLFLYLTKSFDSLVVYEKKFTETLLYDVSSYAILILYILFSSFKITVLQLLIWQIISNLLKTIFYFYLFRQPFDFRYLRIDFLHLKTSFFFFLPAFVGFIQGKTDVFMLMHFMAKTDLGHYQLLLNFAGLFHGGVAAGITPFIRNMFRLKSDAVQKLTLFIKLSTCFLAIPYVFIVRLVITRIYHVYFSEQLYGLFALLLIPFLLYFTKNIILIRDGYATHIAWIYAGGILINTTICMIAIPLAGLEGALIANIITQWLTFLALWFFERRLSK
jgi:O-antigen/teichoic acid export membrane protein